MSVSVHTTKDNILHISVIGELESSSDMENFLSILQDTKGTKTQINFLDATILNDRVIENIVEYVTSTNCKITVTKPYLYSYLQSLQVSCQYSYRGYSKSSSLERSSDFSGVDLNNTILLDFLCRIKESYGYDYSNYQLDSIRRRVKISMLRENISDFNIFQKLILGNQKCFEQLFLDLSINTTSFFRNPEVFAGINNSIIPYLSSYPHIRIWCVGCSTGNEPYSLSILLKEAGLLEKSQIYATDINPFVIEAAKNGLFSLSSLEDGIINYRKFGGTSNFTNYFHLKKQYIKIKDELRNNILFFQHSLLETGLINEFQLILCRNVLIYFNPSLQKNVLRYLSMSLSDTGFLILGTSEGMLQNGGYEYFSKYDEKYKFYKKKVLY